MYIGVPITSKRESISKRYIDKEVIYLSNFHLSFQMMKIQILSRRYLYDLPKTFLRGVGYKKMLNHWNLLHTKNVGKEVITYDSSFLFAAELNTRNFKINFSVLSKIHSRGTMKLHLVQDYPNV